MAIRASCRCDMLNVMTPSDFPHKLTRYIPMTVSWKSTFFIDDVEEIALACLEGDSLYDEDFVYIHSLCPVKSRVNKKLVVYHFIPICRKLRPPLPCNQ